MTTVQTMLRAQSVTAPRLFVAGIFALSCALTGCTSSREDVLTPPETIVAPYDTTRGDVLWAVAPLGNESGISEIDMALVADALVGKIDEVQGISCLPLNRTLAAMRARNMRSVNSPAEARALANALGADGIIVGNVTAYDPYDPPKLGLTLGLFSRDRKAADPFDPMRLQSAYTDADYTIGSSRFADKPVAALSEHLDGANHAVQMDIKRFAAGRHDPHSSLGWRTYLASMTLYTEFAAHLAVSRLIEQERLRVGMPPVTAANAEK